MRKALHILLWLSVCLQAVVMSGCNSTRQGKGSADSAGDQAVAFDESTVADPQPATEPDKEAVPYQLVEQKPTFNGGDANVFSKWVNANLKYPEQAIDYSVDGNVYIWFTIGSDGVVRDVQLDHGLREDLDAESLRVISSSPKWEPGRQNGEAVPVRVCFPVRFKFE